MAELEQANIDGVCNGDQLAALFQVHRKTVMEWAREHGMPRIARGKYRLVDCVRWRCDKLKALAAGETGLEEERKRLVIAQRTRTELENRKTRGELLDADVVANAFNSVAGTFATQLDSLAPRLAVKLAGLDDPAIIQRVLFDECRQIRTATAREMEAFGGNLGGGQDNGTAAGKGRRGMGGRQPGVAAGKSGTGAVADG